MQYFKVKGPCKISGTFTPRGNKNAALPIIAACLLTNEEIILNNLPEIEDVKIMLDIVADLGAEVERLAPNRWRIKAEVISKTEIDTELGSRVRTSILFAGPMLARKGQIFLPRPGGDVIGKRRLDTHFLVFEKLGATHDGQKQHHIYTGNLTGSFIFLDEASVTATENAIMAAVRAQGHTTIYNAACEPHVQDLCNFLNHLGAKINGVGTNRLEIEGVKHLVGGEWQVISDHIEVGSLIGLAAITGGELTIPDIVPEHYINIQKYFAKLGVAFTIEGNTIKVPGGQELLGQADMDGSIPVVADSIWPGFPSDLTSIAIVVATQTKGTVLVHEKLFESRMFFVDKLVSLGARIILCDPHRVVVNGPAKLYPGKITSPDIRAGMAMLLASLIADGESIIHNVGQIDRGYERIDERLNQLGACIQRCSS